MVIGVVVSLSVAIAVHYGIERFYLAWGKLTICITVAMLFLSCNGLHYYLSREFIPYSFGYKMFSTGGSSVSGPYDHFAFKCRLKLGNHGHFSTNGLETPESFVRNRQMVPLLV